LLSLKKTIKKPGYQKPYYSPSNLSRKNIPPLPPNLISLLIWLAFEMKRESPHRHHQAFHAAGTLPFTQKISSELKEEIRLKIRGWPFAY